MTVPEIHISAPECIGINKPPYISRNIPRVMSPDILKPYDFIFHQSYDGIFVNHREPNQVVYATPTYPYFQNGENGRHIVIYMTNIDTVPCPSSVHIKSTGVTPAIKPETFTAFGALVDRWYQKIKPDPRNVVIAFNISSANHALRSTLTEDCERFNATRVQGVAQTIPVLHGHATEIPKSNHEYKDLDFTDIPQVRIMQAKIAKEMHRQGVSVDQIQQFLDWMLFDQETWNAWSIYKEAFINTLYTNPNFQNLTHSWVERLRQHNDQPPYGFEVCTRFRSFDDLVVNMDKIGELLTNYELIIAKNIPYNQDNGPNMLPGYNFCFDIFFEGGYYKCVFSPHNRVRTGWAESMGFFVHRESRPA